MFHQVVILCSSEMCEFGIGVAEIVLRVMLRSVVTVEEGESVNVAETSYQSSEMDEEGVDRFGRGQSDVELDSVRRRLFLPVHCFLVL